MPSICTCPQGHRWKHPGTAPPGAAEGPICPLCGAAAASAVEDTGPDHHAETMTFPPGAFPAVGAPGAGPGVPFPSQAAAPRPAPPPAEKSSFPWLAEAARPEPPRSVRRPIVAAAGATAAAFLAVGALGWLFWVNPLVDAEREQANSLAAERDAQASQSRQIRGEIEAESKAHLRTKAALEEERTLRQEADGRVEKAEIQFQDEQGRRLKTEAALAREKDKLKEAELRHRKQLAAAGQGGGVYADRIALADFELRFKAPARAAWYLQSCAPAARGWEWYYLHGQCSTEVLSCGPLNGPAFAVAYSPDGKRIATASMDQRVRMWDAATGKELYTCRNPTGRFTSMAFSPDGKRLASGIMIGKDFPGTGQVKVWEADSDKEVATLPASAAVLAVAYGPDGQLAASCVNGTIHRWDSNGNVLRELAVRGRPVHGLAFSPDGALLASCDGEFTPKRTSSGIIKIWDTKSGQELLTLTGHPAAVLAVVFGPGGKRLISADAAGHVKFWDATARGTVGASATQRLSATPIRALALGGKRLYVGTSEGTIVVMNPETGAVWRSLRSLTPKQIFALAASPAGERIATSESDKRVHVRDMGERQAARKREAHEGAVSGVAFSADGRLLATAGNDRSVRLWDARTAREIHALGRMARPVAQVIFSPDGKRLVTVGRPSEEADQAIEVIVWDTATGTKAGEVPGQSGAALFAGFGPDGKRLLLAVPGKGLVIWDLQTRNAVDRLEDLPEAPRAGAMVERLASSQDGRRIALAGNLGLTVFHRTAGVVGDEWRRAEMIEPLTGLSGLVWAPRGGLLLVGVQKSVRLQDTVARKVLGHWTGPYPDPRGMTVSADGKRVFTGMGSKDVAVWEYPATPKSRPLFMLRADGGEITYVIASPDGRRLAAGTATGELILWDAPGADVAAAAPR